MSVPSITSTVRVYRGEYAGHAHAHAQILFGLAGRLELELDGRASFADASCGVVIPAGVTHGYLASGTARMLVVDAPETTGLDRIRRFAVTATLRTRADADGHDALLAAVLAAPSVLARRGIDLAALERTVDAALAHPWDTRALAAACFLSPQRFHARWRELTGLAPGAWVRARRLRYAARRLAAGITLDAVASETGYSSASALAYALRRELQVGARGLRSTR